MSGRVRVAYFVGSYQRFTGSQRSLFLMLRGMDRDRVEPVCIFPGEGYATRMYRDSDLRVLVEEPAAALHRFGGTLLRAGFAERTVIAATALAPYTARLARLLRRERVDLLHTNDPRGQLLAAPAARLLGIPVVFHVRGSQKVLGPLYVHACAALADRIIFVSDAIRDSVPAAYARRFRTVYNGIDAPPVAAGRDRDALMGRLPDGALLVTVIGSLVPFKGVHHMIDALRLLDDPRVHLVLVGDRPHAPYGELLDERARGLKVHFVGWDPTPGDWFRAADVVCLPTIESEALRLDGKRTRVVHAEGFSRTVLEAMSYGRPVIATRVAGAAEQIVDGESGLLVPASDPAALAAALRRLVDDAALRARIGAAAERRVRERFSIAQAVAGTLAVYDELIGGRAPAAGNHHHRRFWSGLL